MRACGSRRRPARMGALRNSVGRTARVAAVGCAEMNAACSSSQRAYTSAPSRTSSRWRAQQLVPLRRLERALGEEDARQARRDDGVLVPAAELVGERLRRDDPADAEPAEPIRLREAVDGERPRMLRPERLRLDAVALRAAVHLVGEEPAARRLDDVEDRGPRLGAQDRAGRVVRVDDGEQLRARADLRTELVDVELPARARRCSCTTSTAQPMFSAMPRTWR